MAKNGKLYESDFEEALVDLFEEVGWEYSHGDTISRKFTDPLIEEDLRDYLTCRYSTSISRKMRWMASWLTSGM